MIMKIEQKPVINANSLSAADLAVFYDMFGVPPADGSVIMVAQIVSACCLGMVPGC